MTSVSQQVSQPKPKDILGKVYDKIWSSLCRRVNSKERSKYNAQHSTYAAWTMKRTKRSTLMGLRIGLEHTNSFVSLWEILMCHISPKFQDKNQFLKLWKLTHEWSVHRNKGLTENRFKTEISIKTLDYSIKFDVRRKGEQMNGFYCIVVLLPRFDFGKNSGTLRWLIVQ